ncbi:amidohydrolase [Sphingopyxis sp. JAI128]|uniref:amidohydrolase n=1 Tax=Sphingopyxis sp. JAI128 TaxID=2723066 RepID=UPI001613BCB6|nr:amidohydrolase [Sphingopyxis sp. JAI128]MBB6427162.1 hypothetical protein [Sphingopyxis sp. JAI128]
MMTAIRRSAGAMLLATALGSLSLAAQSPGEPLYADIIFTGGKVITVDKGERIVDSVAVRGNRIVAVGQAGEWKGPATKVVDLKGRTMLPGFIDAHSHIAGMANVEAHHVNVQVPPLADTKAIIAKLREAAAKKPAGAWIIGQGTYNQVFPTRAELDAAFPDNPVRLDWSAHDKMINHRAAVILGMGRDFPDPPKGAMGRYERTADGEVMIIRDAPAPWPKEEFTYPEMKEAVRGVLNDFYLEKGVTTVSDMSPGETYRAYAELRNEGRLPTRIRMNYIARDNAAAQKILDTGISTGLGNDWLQVGALKLFIDGVWGTTAATYRPAWKGSGTTWVPGNYGGTSFDQATLDTVILSAREHGWQVQTHANGDRAQDMVISAFEKANKLAPKPDSRDRIEHFAHFLTQDPERTETRLKRMVDNGIIPSPQVAFLWRLTDVNVKEPAVKFFPLRELIDRGMHPPGGVDTVGTQNFATSPLFSIERAVRRDTKFGTIVQPKQAITPMEGIKMFTIWSAEANFLEKSLGSIEVGKLADFVILEKDPLAARPAEIDEIRVSMTILDGKVVYERK